MDYEPQVDPEHYDNLAYDTKDRFISYWYQIQEVLSVQPEDVLEVGIGSGFVHEYLRRKGVPVHTLDFDARLEPDTVGSVTELPFDDKRFDAACCFETLEHLPWESFALALVELRRVARRYVLLSLPDKTRFLRLDLDWDFDRRSVHRVIDVPRMRPNEHSFDGQHYWEIGKKGYSAKRILAEVEKAGLEVERDFRVQENPYHRFIRCRVR